MKTTGLSAAVLFVAGSNTFAQSESFRARGSSENDVIPFATTRTEIPGEAIVEYGYGNAPFYVRVRNYAMALDRAFSKKINGALQTEANALGITFDELEQLRFMLADYRRQQDADWHDAVKSACMQVGRGAYSNSHAKAFIQDLDNYEGRRNAIAEAVLMNVQDGFGSDFSDKLRS